jgi:glycosyltransferase involved in cell wall biosynthesis
MPLMLMQETDVYITNAVTEEDFEKRKPTTVFYNRIISDDILKLQPRYGFKIVVDVDDYWELDASHILYRHHYENRMNEHHIKHIRLADTVTTTNERLAEEISKINRNVVVLPNAIPTHSYFPKLYIPSANGKTRIFWQGSVTHGKDIEILKGPIQRLNKNKFAMIIAGYMQGEPEWDRMVSFFTKGLRLDGMVLGGADVDKYYANYRMADICVCPLRETRFNAFKSNLKVLEAAHIGAPCIASHVNPYLDIKGVMYVKRQSDWFDYINAGREYWKPLSFELKQWAKTHHNFETINALRKNVLV